MLASDVEVVDEVAVLRPKPKPTIDVYFKACKAGDPEQEATKARIAEQERHQREKRKLEEAEKYCFAPTG